MVELSFLKVEILRRQNGLFDTVNVNICFFAIQLDIEKFG